MDEVQDQVQVQVQVFIMSRANGALGEDSRPDGGVGVSPERG